MAKRLDRPQASSTIANVLNLDAARAAAGQPSRHQVVSTSELPSGSGAASLPFSSTAPTGEFPSVTRQFQLTPTADAALKRLIATYSEATGLDLHASEYMRAALAAMAARLDLHAREARSIGRLRRPKNEASLFHKRDELERCITLAILAAMRAQA